MAAFDVVAVAILSLAALRGLLIGMVREAFSLIALGGAILSVRLFTNPLAAWLRADAGVELNDLALRVLSAVLLIVGVIGAVMITGKAVRRGLRAAGLGWADRLGGGLLGGAEGLLVVGLILAGAIATLGRDSSVLAQSRTLAFFEEARAAAAEPVPNDVAAPPPSL